MRLLTRRHFFGRSATGIGAAALASLLHDRQAAGGAADAPRGALGAFHSAPRAKRVIYLFMSGGPSQLDLFDHKPHLQTVHGSELPDSVRRGQRLTTQTSGQMRLPCVAPMFRFARHGRAGTWVSELLPHTARLADDIAVVTSVHSEAINHDPAITFTQTGSELPGRPSLGAWVGYGIGSESRSLPGFVVLVSQGSGYRNDQPVYSRLWGSGFLPGRHQGVRFMPGRDPVLYLADPPGVDEAARRTTLDAVRELNRLAAESVGDPEIDTRIRQYELAFEMQTSVPELADLSRESRRTLDAYGVHDAGDDGGFARNCLLARRLVERGVRFVQLFHRGWDQHTNLPAQLRRQCRDVDRPVWALVSDLKARGLLDDTLVVWGGEFGRTVYCQGKLTADDYGRDHHGRCFSVWLCGGGVKPGITYGRTDDYGYSVVENPVHVHDLNATILHLLGIDHERLTFRFQGRDFRLTDVHGQVVNGLIR